jgi:transcriptional regulator with XRE-family HTH domain
MILTQATKDIVDRLKKMRKKLGLSQAELAKYIGVSQGNVGSWETGRALPGAIALREINLKFNYSIEWLLTGKDYCTKIEMPPDDFLQEIAGITAELGNDGKAVILGVVRTIVENSLPAREKTLSPLKEESRILDKNADN